MNEMQEDVKAFHEKMGLHVGVQPALLTGALKALRRRLIDEELNKELLVALDNDDIEGIIDGGCDSIYVILGLFVSMGVDLDPFWQEVQHSNMSKTGGGKDSGGKVLKPAGWMPPRIAEILKVQLRQQILLLSKLPYKSMRPRTWRLSASNVRPENAKGAGR